MKRTCKNCRWHNRKCVCTFYRNSNFGRVVYACDHCIDFREKTTIIEKIGEPAVLEQLAEECSELTQAALKLARKMRDENPTPKTEAECWESLKEEMADVMLCMDTYMEKYSNDFYVEVATIRDEKKARWEQRIKEMEDATD